MKKVKFKIAIMDEEAKERGKLLNFFEKDFDVYEISVVKSIEDLIEIIKTEKIDAIAIDYKLKEHQSKFLENGDFYFKNLIERLSDYPAFVLTNDSVKAKRESKLIKPRFIIDKSIIHTPDLKARKTFMQEIKTEIENYKVDISKKISRLKELTGVKKLKGLDE
ncbi:MAG: hypothetical protein WKF91_16930, partial [Segetibacter sp.]